MNKNERIIGGGILLFGSFVVFTQLIILVILPLSGQVNFQGWQPGQYWAITIPAMIFSILLYGGISFYGWSRFHQQSITMTPYTPMKQVQLTSTKISEIEELISQKPKGSTIESTYPIEQKQQSISNELEDSRISQSSINETSRLASREAEGKDIRDIEDLYGISTVMAGRLRKAGFNSVEDIANASIAELTQIKGIGKKTAQKLLDDATAK